jgi:hypothetical protein
LFFHVGLGQQRLAKGPLFETTLKIHGIDHRHWARVGQWNWANGNIRESDQIPPGSGFLDSCIVQVLLDLQPLTFHQGNLKSWVSPGFEPSTGRFQPMLDGQEVGFPKGEQPGG